MSEGRWIRFEEVEPIPGSFGVGRALQRKTRVWLVYAKQGGALLGTVFWFGPWRKYVFEAEPRCVFEQDCLRDIAAAVESRTAEHRALAHERGGRSDE